MIDQQILKLNLQRERLYDQLNSVNTRLLVKSQELTEITNEHHENQEDECERIEENINYMSNRIEQLNAFCKESLDEKKRITDNIKKYTDKRQSLANILQTESRKLEEIKTSNIEIEEQIRLSRLQYEYLQDDIFNLDIKIQNMKKYGMENVPQQIIAQLDKKEELLQQKQELDKRIDIGKAQLDTMFSIDQRDRIVMEIEQLEEKNKKNSQLTQAIEELKRQNEKLNRIKNQYEWNPNLQIKQLEVNEQSEEHKISTIDKEIIAIRKKAAECQQKIQNYKNHLRRQESIRREKQVPNWKQECKRQEETTHLIKSKYCDIKRDLQIQSSKESFSFRESARAIFASRQENNQTIVLDQRTYRVNKTINLVQFWLLVVVFGVLLFYSHRNYKKVS